MSKTGPKRFFQVVSQPAFGSATLLLLRLVVGIAFVIHGWGKIQNPFGWMPANAPISIPSFFQFLAALSEFGGGLALILGLLMPIASLGLAFTMLVAVYFHMIVLKDPFVNATGGMSYEFSLVYCCIAILFLGVGPGKFSVDAQVFGEK